jgi:hypothetical protein
MLQAPHPLFLLLVSQYVEFQEKRFNPTLTIVIRIDTIDIYSKLPVILGYCAIPAFVDAESRAQPLKPVIERFHLNEGGFQLPLRTTVNLGTPEQEFRADALESVPSVPCATLLMRITPAKRVRILPSAFVLSLRSVDICLTSCG